MTTLHQVIAGALAGAVLILFGFFPRPLAAAAAEMRKFTAQFSSSTSVRRDERAHDPVWWMVALGMVLLAASALGYNALL